MRASKDEDRMKVSAFAKWLDLQNRMSLKEVQAVLGSLKYSRTSPVDVIIFDHVLDYLQAKNKKWSDERLVMIDMKPPPQPKKKVEAPAPAPPVEVRTYYEPPAQPRSPLFGRTSEPQEEKPAQVEEEEEAPSRPETSYEFTDARPQSAPADGRRRRKKRKKKRRKSKKRAGFFSLKADDEDAKLPHLRPLAKAQQLSLIEDTLFAPEPGVRAVEEGGGDKSGGDFVVPSGLMSRAMYLTLKAGGAPVVPAASPAKSELTVEDSPQKKQTRGTQHLDELLRKLGVEWEERPSSAPALRRH